MIGFNEVDRIKKIVTYNALELLNEFKSKSIRAQGFVFAATTHMFPNLNPRERTLKPSLLGIQNLLDERAIESRLIGVTFLKFSFEKVNSRI